jgi:hypothetical protein
VQFITAYRANNYAEFKAINFGSFKRNPHKEFYDKLRTDDKISSFIKEINIKLKKQKDEISYEALLPTIVEIFKILIAMTIEFDDIVY